MMVRPRGYKEAFARFFDEPSREGLREVLQDNAGETNNLDFKAEWPEMPKVARHLLGLGNSSGGCMVVSVAQREGNALDPVGLSALKEKTEVMNAIANYLPEPLIGQVDILDFHYEASEYPRLKGKSFQVLIVGYDPAHLPYIAKRDGAGVRRNAIYVRRGTATDEANYEELQRLLSSRVETGYSSRRELDLRTHLEQLKILYEQISPYGTKLKPTFGGNVVARIAQMYTEPIPNPNYPQENFDAFVARAIARKKRRVEVELDIEDIPLASNP